MRLYMHNYTMSKEGIYNPVIGLLKVGMLYPTPMGKLPITAIETGCLVFKI